MYVPLDEWIGTVEGEYLREFVTQGGAAVKFAVAPTSQARERARAELERAGRAAGCQVAYVDAAATKLHLIDQLFFAVARQIDWDALAAAMLRQLLTGNGFVLPAWAEPLDYRTIAEANDYD